MAMRFTATVHKREVVIRDVPLEDGDIVEVTIEREEKDVYILSEEEEREIELGEAEADAGLGRPVDEVIAELRAYDALRSDRRTTDGARTGARKATVGSARPRTKSSGRRRRSGA
jgi:hypothetical protein